MSKNKDVNKTADILIQLKEQLKDADVLTPVKYSDTVVANATSALKSDLKVYLKSIKKKSSNINPPNEEFDINDLLLKVPIPSSDSQDGRTLFNYMDKVFSKNVSDFKTLFDVLHIEWFFAIKSTIDNKQLLIDKFLSKLKNILIVFFACFFYI